MTTKEKLKSQEDMKAFLDNFISNCEPAGKIDAVGMRYFYEWACSLTGHTPMPLESDKNIAGFRVQVTKDQA